MDYNILCVILDSVRAQSTSLHGYERETTPFLEEFAGEATFYTQARAPGLGSVQSHASIFTGLTVNEHRLTVDDELLPENTVWERLGNCGYDTAVFSSNVFLTQAPIGLKNSFQTVVGGKSPALPFPDARDPLEYVEQGTPKYIEFLGDIFSRRDALQSVANGGAMLLDQMSGIPYSVSVDGSTFTDAFKNWHVERNGPWAACINYMDAHTVYRPNPSHNLWADSAAHEIAEQADMPWDFVGRQGSATELNTLESLYDGAIHQADSEVEEVISHLERTGQLEQTLVVIMADHGEGFGEACEMRDLPSIGHGTTGGMAEGILHVPLLVRKPSAIGPDRVSSPATLARFPTVVKHVRTNNMDQASFVPEGPVISSSLGLGQAERRLAEEALTDVSCLEDEGHAVYDGNSDGSVNKFLRYGESEAQFLYRTQEGTVPTGAGVDSLIDNALSVYEPQPVTKHRSRAVSKQVEARLEELGYR